MLMNNSNENKKQKEIPPTFIIFWLQQFGVCVWVDLMTKI